MKNFISALIAFLFAQDKAQNTMPPLFAENTKKLWDNPEKENHDE